MSDRLTIVLNTQSKAPSQYLNTGFDSVVEFNGTAVFFGPDGIYEESGQTDDGSTILAWVDTPLHDFGRREQKSIEALDIGYEADGDLRLTLYGDEDTDNARQFLFPPVKDEGVQQDGMRTLPKYRYGTARYWKVRVANVDGCGFSLDYLAIAPVVLKRHAR